jgi:tetratricopeptide (TPR) repeat protein
MASGAFRLATGFSAYFGARSGRYFSLAAVILAGAAAVGAYVFRPHHAAVPEAAASEYADPATCGACHPAIAKTYRQTGMGRSFYRPRPDTTVEDFKARNRLYHGASDRYYTMTERGGQWFERRHQLGSGGVEANAVEQRIDYVIGSGNHARTYLHHGPDNRLYELPVSWYAENGGYWAMSPGYDRRDQQDFRRAIGFNCMFCHNAYPGAPAASVFSQPAFGESIPEGIDCQRCHGPGRKHAEMAGAGKAPREAIRAAIVNPAGLDRERQLAVCMQCHLEPTSRPLPNVVARFDRGPFDYRPGAKLEDYFLYFDRAGSDDSFEIAHAAYRLRRSKCFQASAMTCTSCHNPHDIPRGVEAVNRYTAACRNCHAAAHASGVPSGGTCVTCHMPRRRAEDAVHVVMTDHYIQRRKPARDLLAVRAETPEEDSGAYRGEVAPYLPAQPPELYRALAQVFDGSNLGAGIPRLRAAIGEFRPEGPEFYYELARAYSKAGEPLEAIRWCEEALRRKPHFLPATNELGAALIAAGQPSRAAEVLAQADDAAALTNLGNAYLRMGNAEGAGQALTKALNANPDAPDAHNLMGMAATQKGDRVAAATHFRAAIASEPDHAEAQYNLANLLASDRDYRQAAYHFEKALAANPAYAEAHHRYGLLLLVSGSYDKAQREFEQAVQLKPKLAQAHSDLADVLAAKGLVDRAANEYRLAIDNDSNAYEAHLSLGLMLARQGRKSDARSHLQQAARSDDPSIRQAAEKALQ